MRALKFKKAELNKITSDTRLSPNRRLLALTLMMYFDAEGPDEKAMMKGILDAEWIDKRGVKLYDQEDIAEQISQAKIEGEAAGKIKAVLEGVLNE